MGCFRAPQMCLVNHIYKYRSIAFAFRIKVVLLCQECLSIDCVCVYSLWLFVVSVVCLLSMLWWGRGLKAVSLYAAWVSDDLVAVWWICCAQQEVIRERTAKLRMDLGYNKMNMHDHRGVCAICMEIWDMYVLSVYMWCWS